jgi:hypothetical protein
MLASQIARLRTRVVLAQNRDDGEAKAWHGIARAVRALKRLAEALSGLYYGFLCSSAPCPV